VDYLLIVEYERKNELFVSAVVKVKQAEAIVVLHTLHNNDKAHFNCVSLALAHV
jgi:hypothetical protein